VAFTIPANTLHSVFASSQMALQTGTVAGTINLDVTLQANNGVSASLSNSVKIARSAPVIRSVTMVKTTGGFEIHITAFSTSRELTEADLQFTAAAGGSLQTTSLVINVAAPASQWFQSAASAPFGSQFVLVLPFTVQGGVDSIGGASVLLKNSVGTSQSSSATF